MGIESVVAKKFPGLKKMLRMAHIRQNPEQYVKRALRLAFYVALGLTATAFFATAKTMPPKKVLA